MEEAYSETNRGFDSGDIQERNFLMSQHKNSVIVEGEWLEMENLEKWLIENIGESPVTQIWYGKLGYNFGIAEYFFNDERNAEKFAAVVPKIYTTYSQSIPSESICKSEGYEKSIPYDETDSTLIVFK